MTESDLVNNFYTELGGGYGDVYKTNQSCAVDRLDIILHILRSSTKKINTVLDLGCGEGTPIEFLQKNGFRVDGVDFSEIMVGIAKLKNPSSKIAQGDILDLESFSKKLDGKYDSVISFGTLGYIEDTRKAIENIHQTLNSDGLIVVNFRNQLFSLVTYNRYTYDFLLNNLFDDVDGKIKSKTEEKIRKIFDLDEPKCEVQIGGPVPRFHNPYEVTELLQDVGFHQIRLHFYNYHAAVPSCIARHDDFYKNESRRLGALNSKSWKSMFLSSAFIAEGIKG